MTSNSVIEKSPELDIDAISPSLQKILSSGVQYTIGADVTKLLELEQSENYIAYNQLLSLLRGGNNNSLSQETWPLYDKIFYVADSIQSAQWDMPMTIHIGSQPFVRLNEKVKVNWIPTVADLRDRISDGILFSGVGALHIQTKEWLRIPLLQRDSGAPTDAGKYTLPAGRADKTPGLTAYEEILEELVLFGKKNDELYLIVPYISGGWISKEKASQLVSIAQGKYINALLKSGNMSLRNATQLISANPIFVPLSISQKWENIKTVFRDEQWNMSHESLENGFFPFHDKTVNTYEMIRWFHLNLKDFDEIIAWDGDWFWRNSQLFSLSEIKEMNLSADVVTSLKWAIELGVFEA